MTQNNLMENKIVMVTGATAGIGQVTALELARMGAQVVVVSRSEPRCQATVDQIRRETGNDRVSYLVADLSSQAQVRSLAQAFHQQFERLDVLVNNAGAFIMRRKLSPDGIEMTWALNHLNYFLLTLLLLDRLDASPAGRVVSVSSNAHVGGRIHFDDLQGEKSYSGWRAYAQSKLANILFTYELARRLQGTHITANCLHPGFVATNFAKNNGWLVRLAMPLVSLAAISPDEGAQTSIYLASSPEVENVTGKYFVRQKQAKSDPASYDEETARRLWEVSLQMTGMEEPALLASKVK